MGNAIGPITVTASVTTVFFTILLLTGLLDKRSCSQMALAGPQLSALIVCAALGALIAFGVPDLDLIAPAFVYGKTDGSGRAY